MYQSGNLSVIDHAAHELESRQATIHEDLEDFTRCRVYTRTPHEKRHIKVSRYPHLPEFGSVSGNRTRRICPPCSLGEVRGAKVMTWERNEDTVPLVYKMVSMWAQEAKGPEILPANSRLFQGVVPELREKVSVADRIAVEFKSPPVLPMLWGRSTSVLALQSLNQRQIYGARAVIILTSPKRTEEAREFLIVRGASGRPGPARCRRGRINVAYSRRGSARRQICARWNSSSPAKRNMRQAGSR
jgi:hypothetical protein